MGKELVPKQSIRPTPLGLFGSYIFTISSCIWDKICCLWTVSNLFPGTCSPPKKQLKCLPASEVKSESRFSSTGHAPAAQCVVQLRRGKVWGWSSPRWFQLEHPAAVKTKGTTGFSGLFFYLGWQGKSIQYRWSFSLSKQYKLHKLHKYQKSIPLEILYECVCTFVQWRLSPASHRDFPQLFGW